MGCKGTAVFINLAPLVICMDRFPTQSGTYRLQKAVNAMVLFSVNNADYDTLAASSCSTDAPRATNKGGGEKQERRSIN